MVVILLLICFIVAFMLCGENGSNKFCANSNMCSGSVRCKAKSEKDCECFRER